MENVKHNICCVIADSLRWDVFVEANPQNILRLGRAQRCYSFGCCTLPSIMGMLMNYPPIGVGLGLFDPGTWEEMKRGDAVIGKQHKAIRKWMPKYYKERGYVTIWESGNPVPIRIDRELNGAISRYFDHWQVMAYLKDVATPLIIKDLDCLVKAHVDEPIFAVVLLLDTHSPYHDGEGEVHLIDPRQPDINRHRQLQAMKYIDNIFPNFINIFKRTGRPTEFIFTSDHGEDLGGRGGWGHSPFRASMAFSPQLFEIPFVRARIEDWSKVRVNE